MMLISDFFWNWSICTAVKMLKDIQTIFMAMPQFKRNTDIYWKPLIHGKIHHFFTFIVKTQPQLTQTSE